MENRRRKTFRWNVHTVAYIFFSTIGHFLSSYIHIFCSVEYFFHGGSVFNVPQSRRALPTFLNFSFHNRRQQVDFELFQEMPEVSEFSTFNNIFGTRFSPRDAERSSTAPKLEFFSRLSFLTIPYKV